MLLPSAPSSQHPLRPLAPSHQAHPPHPASSPTGPLPRRRKNKIHKSAIKELGKLTHPCPPARVG